MATKKLSFDELKAHIDGAPWDDQELCVYVCRHASRSDPDNVRLYDAAYDLLNAICHLEELLKELEIERGGRMATISELMEGKAPGGVKVRRSGWNAGDYFVPYFIDQDGDWRGTIEGGNASLMTDERDDWVLYTEPKRKVAMYLWALAFPVGDRQHISQSTAYYATEAEVREYNPGLVWCQRLDYTKIEVEEDV